MIRQFFTSATRNKTVSQALTRLEQAGQGRLNRLVVLTYHHVDVPDAFDEQMRYLAKNYQVVSMPEVLEVYKHGGCLPSPALMITFDDAYTDFMTHAWPILKRYQLPVTLFVSTAFPDHPERSFWWEQLEVATRDTHRRDELDTPFGRLSLATASQRARAFERLRNYAKTLPHHEAITWVGAICQELGTPHPEQAILRWDELRQLAREGVTLGAHTQNHPLMNRISVEEAQSEAIGSLRDIEREVGQALPIFAYPGGSLNDLVVAALERAGFLLAFTTIRGTNDLLQADRLRLRRNNVGRRASLAVLRARLLQSSFYFNRLRPDGGRKLTASRKLRTFKTSIKREST